MFTNFTLFFVILFQVLVFTFYYRFLILGFFGYLSFIVLIYEFFLLFWVTGFNRLYTHTCLIRFLLVSILYFYLLLFFKDWFILSQQFGIEVFIFFIILELFLTLIL